MIVTFCGHRDIQLYENTKQKLYSCCEELIKQGATEFLLGGYGIFDSTAAKVVMELQSIYPHIKSILVVPYINRSFDRFLYDESIYPPLEKTPLRFAISKRNEWMVNKCDVLVCYISHTYGGAYTTYLYAQKKKKTIINLY